MGGPRSSGVRNSAWSVVDEEPAHRNERLSVCSVWLVFHGLLTFARLMSSYSPAPLTNSGLRWSAWLFTMRTSIITEQSPCPTHATRISRRMSGPPIIAIRDEMLPQIVDLLQRNGIDCESVPLGATDDPQRFLLLLRCTRAGAVVRLSVQCEPHVNSDGPIVAFGAVYADHEGRLKALALSEAITEVLVVNGGWIPTRGGSD